MLEVRRLISSPLENSKVFLLLANRKKVSLTINEIVLAIARGDSSIASLAVRGLSADLLLKEDQSSTVNSCLREFSITDLAPDAVHSKVS